jgi:hypothetical protein
MSKPGRMGTLAAAAPLAFVTGAPIWLTVAAWIILIGGVVTAAARVNAARRELD